MAALLGTASAALGSAQEPNDRPRRRIQARFVGDGFERGHHWILPDPEKLHVDRRERKGVVIVGAGLAGLAAAWRLIEAGVDDFVLLELEDTHGGFARSGLMGATSVPFGGLSLPYPDAATQPVVTRLFELAGVAPASAPAFAPAAIGGGPAVDVLQAPGAADTRPLAADLDRLSVAESLAREKADAAPARLAARFCLLRFGARPADVSALAFVRERRPRFAVPGGLGALAAPLAAQAGERVRKAMVAVLAREAPDGGALIRAVDATTATVTDFQASAAVLAVPPFIAARIAPAFRARAREVALPQNSPWLVSAVMLPEWPKGLDPGVPFQQSGEERATLVAPIGKPPEAVVVHHRPFPGTATMPARMFLRDLDPASGADWVLRELEPLFPGVRELATRVEMLRVGHGPVRPAPGFITETAPKLRAPAPPVWWCGADWSGLPSAPAAVEDGVRGAEEVLRALGKEHRSWLR